jgi:hypothetical protein
MSVGCTDGLEALSSAFLEAHQNAFIVVLMDKLLLQRFVRPDPSCRVLRDRFEPATPCRGSHPPAEVTAEPVSAL